MLALDLESNVSRMYYVCWKCLHRRIALPIVLYFDYMHKFKYFLGGVPDPLAYYEPAVYSLLEFEKCYIINTLEYSADPPIGCALSGEGTLATYYI